MRRLQCDHAIQEVSIPENDRYDATMWSSAIKLCNDTDVSVRLVLVLSGFLIIYSHYEYHREDDLELCQFPCLFKRGFSGWVGKNIIPTLKF